MRNTPKNVQRFRKRHKSVTPQQKKAVDEYENFVFVAEIFGLNSRQSFERNLKMRLNSVFLFFMHVFSPCNFIYFSLVPAHGRKAKAFGHVPVSCLSFPQRADSQSKYCSTKRFPIMCSLQFWRLIRAKSHFNYSICSIQFFVFNYFQNLKMIFEFGTFNFVSGFCALKR